MEVNDSFHDKVAELCFAQFKLLPKSGKPSANEWTVLSCIILEFGIELSVVALGTGSKCIGKSKMTKNGDILNDSHAEVICRRSFLRYLYYEIKNNILFTFNEESKRYSMNSHVKFHFFTTHVPCGDAAIFSQQNSDDFGKVISQEGEDLEIPVKKIKTSTCQTGAKCLIESDNQDSKLSDTICHVTGVVRTKPGRGDPTLSVSCSDKLAKWCCLGIQGALLSLLLENPVYLSSFTIVANSPFCKESLKRALYSRLTNVNMVTPYCQKKLIIGRSKYNFEFCKDDNKKPCHSSISWCKIAENNLEVSVLGKRQGVTKKTCNASYARLKISKYELFRSFVEICSTNNITFQECDINACSYKKLKMSAIDYQNSWKILRRDFKIWTNKDPYLLDFLLSD